MAQQYESVAIFAQETTQDQIDASVEKIREVVTANEGAVDAVEPWGQRDLAYPIEDNTKGHYVLLRLTAGAEALQQIERVYKLDESVIRSLTVVAEPVATKEDN